MVVFDSVSIVCISADWVVSHNLGDKELTFKSFPNCYEPICNFQKFKGFLSREKNLRGL